MQALSLKTLDIATGYLGEDRAHNQAQIAKFLALFGLPFAQNGVPVSFCAAGVCYALCKAYALLHGIPFTADNAVTVFHGLLPRIARELLLLDPRCHILIEDAKKRGIYRAGLAGAKPGDWVFFCWNGSGVAEHVGIVVRVEGNVVYTLEFNTSGTDTEGNQTDGGTVAHKTRSGRLVVGHIAF